MECLRVLDINDPIPAGFKLATFADIVDVSLLETVLREKEWHICRLQDGEVSGPGYGYEIRQKIRAGRYGHQLLCMTMHSGEKVLQLVKEGAEAPGGYQLAKVEDIVRLHMLQEALEQDEWYICQLNDGFVTGRGYAYQTRRGTHIERYGHKLTVGPSEIADGLKSLLEMSKERPKLSNKLHELCSSIQGSKNRIDRRPGLVQSESVPVSLSKMVARRASLKNSRGNQKSNQKCVICSRIC